MKILILGASYTGKYIHDHFPEHAVQFRTRNPDALIAMGCIPFFPAMYDPEDPFDLIIDTVPAVFDKDSEAEPFYRRDAVKLLSVHPHIPYVHVSSTSVYSQGNESENGSLEVMDEDSVPEPQTESGRKRLLLEKSVKLYFPDAVIVRSGGIYGPNRGIINRIKKGSFRGSDENRMISRIHVHDLARLCTESPRSGKKIINAVDENPSSNRESYAFLEEIMDVKIPGKWRTENVSGRIIKSLHAKKILGEFAYPSYREGFPAVLSAFSR